MLQSLLVESYIFVFSDYLQNGGGGGSGGVFMCVCVSVHVTGNHIWKWWHNTETDLTHWKSLRRYFAMLNFRLLRHATIKHIDT